MEMVRACLRVLKHHGMIALVDMFFFSNRYEPTEQATALLAGKDVKILQDAVDFAIRQPTHYIDGSSTLQSGGESHDTSHDRNFTSYPPERLETGSFRGNSSYTSHASDILQFASPKVRDDYHEIKQAIAEFYCLCNRRTSIGDIWISLLSQSRSRRRKSSVDWKKCFQVLDHRRLITFGVVHELIKRVHNFPLLLNRYSLDTYESLSEDKIRHFARNDLHRGEDLRYIKSKAASMMDGRHCDDEIVSACDRSIEEVYNLFNDADIISVFATLE